MNADDIPVVVDKNVPEGLLYLINPDYLRITPEYTMWKSYETAAPAELTVGTLRAAIEEVRGPALPWAIVSPAEYERMMSFYSPREVKLSKFQAFVARVKVVLRAAPTYLVAAAVLLPFIASEVTPLLPTE